MRLELSRKAQADLDDIRDFSVSEFGNERAIAYLDAIEQSFRRLLDHPRIGTSRAELRSGVRSYPIGEHRIYYRLTADRVSVIRLLHKSVDDARHV